MVWWWELVIEYVYDQRQINIFIWMMPVVYLVLGKLSDNDVRLMTSSNTNNNNS